MPNKGFKHSPETKRRISESLMGNTRSLGYAQSVETLEKKRLSMLGNQHTKGHKLTEEHRRKVSESLKGKTPWNKGKKLSHEIRQKISDGGKNVKRSEETRKKMSGENNHNWKGGVTPANSHSRLTYEAKAWKSAVLKRDNYTCQICEQYGGDLHIDHIKQFADYPELRYDIENGRSLCRACHYYITFKRKMSSTSKWGLTDRRIELSLS
jgi:5-methylcytosine-specific restriction protein A